MTEPDSLQQLFADVAARYATRPAIVSHDGAALTYAQLAGRAALLASVIQQRGVAPGDSVALLLPNGVDFVASYFGALVSGAVVVPMNAQYQRNELRYFLDVCRVRALITTREHETLCREVLAMGDLPVDLVFVEDHASPEAAPLPLAGLLRPPSQNAPVMFQFSSGSTGRPKQIARTHRNLLLELSSLRTALAIQPDDRFLGLAPFSHVNGLVRSMLACLTSGASLYPLPKFERQAAADTVAHHRLTVFIGVPFHFSMLAKASFAGPPDFSSLRICACASAPMPHKMNELFHQRFGLYVRQLYGSTETGTISVNLEPDPGPAIDTVGKPIPGVEVQVLLDDGTVAPPDELGEFVVKSPTAIRSYIDAEEANREAFRDGWFFTGDLGRRDAHGLLTIAGRKKFFINKGGYKIDPKEIEDLLESHPKVEEAVAIGVPTSYGDEKVTAVIVANTECSPAEIIEFCQGKIAPFKIPSIVDVRDSIPKSPAGKIRRAMLYPT